MVPYCTRAMKYFLILLSVKKKSPINYLIGYRNYNCVNALEDLGSYINYVDQILPNFDSRPTSSGQKSTFYIIFIYSLSRDQPCRGLTLPLLVNVIFECPLA